ncbi:MAG: hypothetical protein LQ351_003466 [Letrouitia transgressa]|nr:MAG: hypothetical protein LQ351_003466 [Letrouitia transgressa]
MPVETQFNLALELAQVFNLGAIVKTGATAFLDFARELRKSGSDIVVEEDLADNFGRGRIVPQLEESFRKEVVANATITPVYAGSEISLCSGPGPTVLRALKEKDRKYLSTVIQLSFLGWVHERDSLSEALSNCILERSKLLSDPYAVPGFEDVKGSLEVCSSQTSSFVWDNYIRYVDHSLQQKGFSYHETWHEGLRRPILLAAMDCFYVVQRLPEDRSMLIKVDGMRGIVHLVVWAHCILGLSVSVQDGNGKGVTFGVSSHLQLTVLTSGTKTKSEEILLLDREMEVVLRTDILQHGFSELAIDTMERHTLRNYGSDMLRRTFNSTIATADENPVYYEAINLIVAYTIAFNSNITYTNVGRKHEQAGFNSHQSEQWRIFDAAVLMFYDFTQTTWRAKIFDMNVYHEMIKGRSICDSLHLNSKLQPYLDTSNESPSPVLRTGSLERTVMRLIDDLLVLAHASNTLELAMLPIIQRPHRRILPILFGNLNGNYNTATPTLNISS